MEYGTGQLKSSSSCLRGREVLFLGEGYGTVKGQIVGCVSEFQSYKSVASNTHLVVNHPCQSEVDSRSII